MTKSKDEVVTEAVVEKTTAPAPKKATKKKAVAKKAPAKIKVRNKANGGVIYKGTMLKVGINEIDSELANEIIERIPAYIEEVK